MVHCLADPEGILHEEETAVAMGISVLEKMTTHFFLHRKSWVRDGRAWCMLRQGMEESYWTDY